MMTFEQAVAELSPDIATWMRDAEKLKPCPECGEITVLETDWDDEFVHASTGFRSCG